MYISATASEGVNTGVPLIKTDPPQDPTAGLCLDPCGGPKGVSVSYERGTPVHGGRVCGNQGLSAFRI